MLLGTTIFTSIVIIVNLKLALETKWVTSKDIPSRASPPLLALCLHSSGQFFLGRGWGACWCRSFTLWNIFLILGSIASFYLFVLLLSTLYSFWYSDNWASMYEVAQILFSSSTHWLIVFLSVVVALLRDYLCRGSAVFPGILSQSYSLLCVFVRSIARREADSIGGMCLWQDIGWPLPFKIAQDPQGLRPQTSPEQGLRGPSPG